MTVDGRTYDHDVYVRADGEVTRRDKKPAKRRCGTSHCIGAEELEALCADRPDRLFIGTGQNGAAELTDDGREYLRGEGIDWEARPTPDILAAYNAWSKRKAALIHVTC